MINDTYYLKSIEDAILASLSLFQRVHDHDAVLIKENESDQRESNGNPKDQRNFTGQRNLN